MRLLRVMICIFFTINSPLLIIVKKNDDVFAEIKENKMNEQDKLFEKRKQMLQNGFYDIVYVGMARNDFEDKFGKYITRSEGPYIYFSQPGIQVNSRVKFNNGLLEQYEVFTRSYGIWGTGHYNEHTFFLKGYKAKNAPGFFSFMREDQFLDEFSNNILSSRDYKSYKKYIVIGKNGKKYKVTFTKGFLTAME